MLTFAMTIAGLTLLALAARGIASFVRDRRKGRVWGQSAWAGVIGWFAMLSLFLLLLANLYI